MYFFYYMFYLFIENCNPYFKVGEENNFGVKSVINENFMNDSCLSLKYTQIYIK